MFEAFATAFAFVFGALMAFVGFVVVVALVVILAALIKDARERRHVRDADAARKRGTTG